MNLTPFILLSIFVFSTLLHAQSIEVLSPFDGTVKSDELGDTYGLDTFGWGVSANGEVVYGAAQKNLIRIVDGIQTGPGPFDFIDSWGPEKTIVYRMVNGRMTELPFSVGSGMGWNSSNQKFGISADGSRVFGPSTENAYYLDGPFSVSENFGSLSAGSFGPWVDFRPGLRRRINPVGRWRGESSTPGDVIRAVSDDFTHFVGESGNQATVWTATTKTTIPTLTGFRSGVATGVSGDGRVVCGFFSDFEDDDDEETGDAGFVWLRNSGTLLLRDLARPQGFPFDDDFPDIMPYAVSADGGTVVGSVDGIDSEGRWYAFKVKLGPAVYIRLPQPPYSVGEAIDAEVVAFTASNEPQTFSFSDGLLHDLFGDRLELEFAEGEEGAIEPFILTPDDRTRSFTVKVTPLVPGNLGLTTSATVTSTTGSKELTDTKEFFITPLKVSLKMLPVVNGKPILNVKLQEDGGITDEEGNPVVPKVKVTVENLGVDPVKASLQGVDPRARDRSDGPARLRTVGTFPIDLGTIAAGQAVAREIDMEIVDDGRFDFTALVSAAVEGSPRGFNAAGRGAPLAVGEPYPAKLELEFVRTPSITNQNNGAFFVVPGTSLKILATIENLTSNSTLKFYGMKAEKKLNALGAVLTSDEGNLSNPPFPHDHEVDANASAVLSGNILTDADGAGSGTVTWQGLEDIVLVDDETGDETELTMDDILVDSTAGGWLGNDLGLRIIQDRSRDVERTPLTGTEEMAYFSYGAILGVGQWTYDTLDSIGGVGRLAGTIWANPSIVADTIGEGSRAVWEAAELMSTTWEHMTPEQKEAFIGSLSAEVQRRALLLATTRQPFDAEDGQAALEFTRNATYGLFGGVENAYASDDPAQISQYLGQISGNVAMEVVTSALPTPQWKQYVSGTEALLEATNLNKAGLITSQGTLLRSLRGAVDHPTVRKAWGIGGKQLADIQTLFRKMGVKGYMRERSPTAFRLIDQLAEAVWKPELMKPKGFSELDELILADLSVLPKALGRNGEDLGLDGITMIFLPEADEIIGPRVRSRLQSRGNYPSESIDAAVEACLERAKKRREEFADYLPEFEAWKADTVVNDGGIPVARNYKDNGIPDPGNAKEIKRAFDFQRYEREGAEIIYIPKMADEAGNLKFISGDTDFVHFSFLDGSPLDPKTARKLYDAMIRSCGLQHPETITWILEGQTVFKGKINQLAEYLNGSNALLEIGGDSLRAVHMKDALTRFAKNGRDHLIFFDSGLKSRQRALAADIESAFAYAKSHFPDRRVLVPFLRTSRFNQALQNAGADGWTYTTRDNEAVLLREDSAGAFQIHDGSKWIPWTPAGNSARGPVRKGGGSPLGLTPTSDLFEEAKAGDVRISITDLPARWPTELAGHVDNWFAPGQRIVIEPGELTQEIGTIAAGASTTLTEPLQYDHPRNAMVAVIPGNLAIITIPNGASKLLSIAEDKKAGKLTLVWESIAGRAYQLQIMGTSGNWQAVGDPVGSDGPVVSVAMAAATYQPSAAYRLLDVGPVSSGTVFAIRSFTMQPGATTGTLSWSSQAGAVYAIHDSRTLLDGSWRPVGNPVTAGGPVTSVDVPLIPSDKRRFFRIVLISTP